MARAILACGLLLVAAGLTGCSGSTYLIKPDTADPVHVVRCETHLSAKSALLAMIFLPLGFIVQWQDYQNCLELRHNEGYADAPEEPECAYWRDDKPGQEIKIPDSCKKKPPEWTSSGVEAQKNITPPPPPPVQRQAAPADDSGRWAIPSGDDADNRGRRRPRQFQDVASRKLGRQRRRISPHDLVGPKLAVHVVGRR